jgi:hypothetical protein
MELTEERVREIVREEISDWAKQVALKADAFLNQLKTKEAALVQELIKKQEKSGLSDDEFGRKINLIGYAWVKRKQSMRLSICILFSVKKAFPDLNPLIDECLRNRNADVNNPLGIRKRSH